tara:strand:- start:107 stop:469 length:363 start_codon:yes stop_codon:yes gene_type:complete
MTNKNDFSLDGSWELKSIEMYKNNSLSGANEIHSQITYNFIPNSLDTEISTGSLQITEDGQTTSNEFVFESTKEKLSINATESYTIEMNSVNEFIMINRFDDYKMVYKFIRIKNELSEID